MAKCPEFLKPAAQCAVWAAAAIGRGDRGAGNRSLGRKESSHDWLGVMPTADLPEADSGVIYGERNGPPSSDF